MSFGGLVWGTMALVLGLSWQSTIPYGYTAITVLNLMRLSRGGSFSVARAVQVLISLLLPFALQWSLGGFVPSGAMMIWALLALTASQSFGDTRISVIWLGFFLLFMAVSVSVDHRLWPQNRTSCAGRTPIHRSPSSASFIPAGLNDGASRRAPRYSGQLWNGPRPGISLEHAAFSS